MSQRFEDFAVERHGRLTGCDALGASRFAVDVLPSRIATRAGGIGGMQTRAWAFVTGGDR